MSTNSSESYKKIVARAVLRAPEFNPNSGMRVDNEIVLTVRPGWSNIGKYQLSLPGGKIETGDFPIDLDLAQQDIVTKEIIIAAAIKAIVRELFEELGIEIAPSLLKFVLETTNDSGWTTYLFAADLPNKPTLQVKPDSAGTIWISEDQLQDYQDKLFADHGYMIYQAISIL